MLSIALSFSRKLLFCGYASIAGVTLSGCAGGHLQGGAYRPAEQTSAIRTELYFGEMAEKTWREFLAEEVTPRFPDGLTWFPAHGQWREKDGRISKETSRVLILVHGRTAPEEEKIEQLRATFTKRYDHESVLRVSAPVQASF